MPLILVPPECVLTYEDIKIYRCYRCDMYDNPYEFYYTTSKEEDIDEDFDIRELEFPYNWIIDLKNKIDVCKVLMYAIDTKQI